LPTEGSGENGDQVAESVPLHDSSSVISVLQGHRVATSSSTRIFSTGGEPTMPTPSRNTRNDSPKVRATLYLSADVLDQARDATVYLAGFPARLTLTKLAEDALRAELQRLKERYNQGKDFPRREEELRGGRPIAA
jgi:hypothetical protein